MRKVTLLKWVLLLALFPLAGLSAKETTPVETFIRQVKETNPFVQVSNIWQTDDNFDKTELLRKVSKATPLVIDYTAVADFIHKNNTAISLVVPGSNGATYTIELAQYSYLSNDFEVHAKGHGDQDGICKYTPGLYYSGVVKGIPGSVAAFSFFNNEVYGIFSIPGEGNYVLVPNTMVGEYYNYNQHYLLYNDADLKILDQAPGCATDQLPTHYLDAKQKTTTTLNNNVYNTCREVKVFEVADHTMYVKKGSNTTTVTNFMTALFNNQATLYRNEGIPIVLSYVQVDTATDVYGSITVQNSIRYLDLFGYTTQTTMHGCNVAILLTTHSGNMGGVAWLQTACTGYYATDSAGPYGFCNIDNNSSTTVTPFPTYSWNVEVITHEMGHIVGSPHTHACVWNPPARNTVIDKCYTLEGSCSPPSSYPPASGGTIMSYCHLVSGVGIGFNLGFGQQPGDTIRYYLSHNSCGGTYTPTVVLGAVNRTISANKECTDLVTGNTYYWKDNNTAAHTDDTLVLIINKNGNNIGNLNTTGFSVTSATVANYGIGKADTIIFPAATPHVLAPNYSMRRYWQVKATTEPTTPVEVIFPFTATDTADITGSAGSRQIISYKMYKVKSPVNPNPALDSFRYTTTANVTIYTYDPSIPSTTKWSLSSDASGYYAHMLVSTLSGGGSGFSGKNPVGINNVSVVNDNIYIYPNPTNDKWFVNVGEGTSNEQLTFTLYTADGKLFHTQILQTGTTNSINPANVPAGVYYYRIISTSNTYTGTLIKK